MTAEEYIEGFTEEPGYLNFSDVGPIGQRVRTEESAQSALLGRARFGTLDSLAEQNARVCNAVASLIGFRPDQVGFQPNTNQALMHVMFGLTGGVALSSAEVPSITFAAVRAVESMGVLVPTWLEADHGRLTPGDIRDQLTTSVVAVAVSLVDFRTGYLIDLEGIRQVIGDRLLIVDASQGFGVVDAPYAVADVVVAAGHTWMRAGWGTGFLALSERAVDQLTPVFSGFGAIDAAETPVHEVPLPARGVSGFAVSHPDSIAQARFATAVEDVADVGVTVINGLLVEKVSALIDLADEFGIAVSSPRAHSERAGIVVLEPAPEHVTVLAASLHNHGVTVTVRHGAVRVSPHVTTTDETFAMLRASLLGFRTVA